MTFEKNYQGFIGVFEDEAEAKRIAKEEIAKLISKSIYLINKEDTENDINVTVDGKETSFNDTVSDSSIITNNPVYDVVKKVLRSQSRDKIASGIGNVHTPTKIVKDEETHL